MIWIAIYILLGSLTAALYTVMLVRDDAMNRLDEPANVFIGIVVLWPLLWLQEALWFVQRTVSRWRF